ncbi:ATP-dependent nuclease [Salinigranum marinum]|uniref:ATP-dependent nuclease n=1 Tax=Salinigranum marinum TaxID=1515595 RepID=UPI002989E582|nr:AAA family ATPase [Salinigranum marinum]
MMRLSGIQIKNFKSIERTQIESVSDLSVLVGKNDAGKSSLLEAIEMFLTEKGKPTTNQFHMGTEDDIIISALFSPVPDELADALDDSIEIPDNTLQITRKWEYPDPRRSMAETYLGPDEVAIGADTLVGEYDSLGKPDTRDFLWEYLPEPVYIPAERNVTEETTFKSNTLIDQLLTPLLEESDALRQARKELESELNREVGAVQEQIEEGLVSRMDSIRHLELDTGEINLGKAFTPSIRITDQYSEMSVPIDQRGSGVGSMLVLSLVETYRERHIGEGYLLLFEEPGNWLHPEAKRRMLGALKQISTNGGQVMLSTHSPEFIDRRGHGDVILVQRDAGRTSVRQIEEDYLSVIEELGARNSDILQSDFVVYVEGSTDVQMLRVVADNHLSEADRARITIQHLGGSGNIRQCDPAELAEINRNFGFLLDSDRSSPDDSEKPYIRDLREQCDTCESDVLIRVLERREIENYFTPEGINEALGLEVSEGFVSHYVDIPDKLCAEIARQYTGRDVPSQEERTCSECGRIHRVGNSYKKSQGKSIVEAMYREGQSIETLESFLDEVVERIS